jgi:hypothetical protein
MWAEAVTHPLTWACTSFDAPEASGDRVSTDWARWAKAVSSGSCVLLLLSPAAAAAALPAAAGFFGFEAVDGRDAGVSEPSPATSKAPCQREEASLK